MLLKSLSFLFSQVKGEEDSICFVHMALTLISMFRGLFILLNIASISSSYIWNFYVYLNDPDKVNTFIITGWLLLSLDSWELNTFYVFFLE